jgi:ECF sigma factor
MSVSTNSAMTKQPPDADVTELLQAWGGGDMDARDRLATAVYQELRRRAGAYLRRERVGHTLQCQRSFRTPQLWSSKIPHPLPSA